MERFDESKTTPETNPIRRGYTTVPCDLIGFIAGKEKTDAKEHSTPRMPHGYPNRRIAVSQVAVGQVAVGQGSLARRTLGLTFVIE